MDEKITEQISKKELPTGFKCKCGTEHRYGVYVYAHWGTPLLFKCPGEGCGREWEVLRGRARLVRKS